MSRDQLTAIAAAAAQKAGEKKEGIGDNTSSVHDTRRPSKDGHKSGRLDVCINNGPCGISLASIPFHWGSRLAVFDRMG